MKTKNGNAEKPMLLDVANHCIIKDGEETYLTRMELKLLLVLMGTNGKFISTSDISFRMFGLRHSEDRVRVFIKRLRDKMKTDGAIITHTGFGYQLKSSVIKMAEEQA